MRGCKETLLNPDGRKFAKSENRDYSLELNQIILKAF